MKLEACINRLPSLQLPNELIFMAECRVSKIRKLSDRSAVSEIIL